MSLPAPSTSTSTAAAAATASITNQISQHGSIVVGAELYTGVACFLALAGVWLSRRVSVDSENRRLGRLKPEGETWPLTWIAALIVVPLVWHYDIAIPWASLMGLSVGWSTKAILRILGAAGTSAAKQMLRAGLDSLETAPAPDTPPVPSEARRINAAIVELDKQPDA